MAVDKHENTVLYFVVIGGCTALIPRLIASGVKLEAKSSYGSTAFQEALYGGKAEVAEALLEAGADVMGVDRYGNTALHYAARLGCTALIPRLIASGVKLEAKNSPGRTALLEALDSGQTEAAEVLLETGADVMAVAKSESNALHYAARGSCKAVVPSLIGKGVGWKTFLKSGASRETSVFQLVQIFDKVQECFDPTLLQSLAKYLELLLQDQQKKSLLLIEPYQLRDLVLQNFKKIAPTFFKPFAKHLQEVQILLKETNKAIDEDKVRVLLTRAIAERIALILSLSSRTAVASVWKSCIDILMFEPLNDKALSVENFTILPKSLVDLTLSYVWGEGAERRAFGQKLEFLNETDFLEMIEKELGIQASTDKLEQRLLDQRLSSCYSYLAQRAVELRILPQGGSRPISMSPNTLVLFRALFPKTLQQKAVPCVGAKTIETKLCAEEQSLIRKGQSKDQVKFSKNTEKICESSAIHIKSFSISGSPNSPLYEMFKAAESSVQKAVFNTTPKSHS